MKKFMLALYYLIYFAGILILWIAPVNKYEWMQEMDETIKKLPQDSSGDIGIVIAILVGILVLLSLIRFKFSKGWIEKGILVALALITIVLWLLK